MREARPGGRRLRRRAAARPWAAAAPERRSRQAPGAASGTGGRPSALHRRSPLASRDGPVASAMATVRRSISTKAPDSGRLDQSELAVTWNSTMRPSPRGRALSPAAYRLPAGPRLARRPGRARISQHLSLDRDVLRYRHAVERAVLGVGRELSAAGSTTTRRPARGRPAQRHRQQLVAAALQSRTREPDQQPAILDPAA